jgi:hypothetical protein
MGDVMRDCSRWPVERLDHSAPFTIKLMVNVFTQQSDG